MKKSYRVLTPLVSQDGLKSWNIGDVIRLDDQTAAILLKVGAVETVVEEKKIQRAKHPVHIVDVGTSYDIETIAI